ASPRRKCSTTPMACGRLSTISSSDIASRADTRLTHPREDAWVPPLLPSKTPGGEGFGASPSSLIRRTSAHCTREQDKPRPIATSLRYLALSPRDTQIPTMPDALTPGTVPAALTERLRAIVGPRGVVDDAAEM